MVGFTDPLHGKSSAPCVKDPYRVNKSVPFSGQILCFPWKDSCTADGSITSWNKSWNKKKQKKKNKKTQKNLQNWFLKVNKEVLKEDISCTPDWKYSWKYIH